MLIANQGLFYMKGPNITTCQANGEMDLALNSMTQVLKLPAVINIKFYCMLLSKSIIISIKASTRYTAQYHPPPPTSCKGILAAVSIVRDKQCTHSLKKHE